jgi:thiosulfate/3-mercaptopyruvate sulfurtransferase
MRGGHIPGAINRPSVLNLNPDNEWRYHDAQTLREEAETAGIKPNQRVITYCGCGISASLGLFALHLAGYRDLALYDASWEEWGANQALPIVRDEPSAD